ncbi:MAG: D-alanine--D-alanine ligase [Deltaproteobacteria bacterium]|nr:D-alanine--D-alanine ligase [Deltaproteobacteria bacterium]
MRVGVIFGGRSVEHVVSVRSARTVVDGLRQAGHEAVPLGIAENGAWVPPDVATRTLAGTDKALPVEPGDARASLRHLLDAKLDAAFPIVHGTYGEDGCLQGLLEMLDVPYVGCGVAASAVAMDKLLSKRLFERAGLPVVPYAVVSRAAFDADVAKALAACDALPEPLFVKPSVGGSSVGCKLVKRRADLAEAVRFALRFDDTVLVEQGVKAREVEVAVLGRAGALQASAIGEIVPGGEFYDYEDKYLKDDAKLLAPAPLPDDVATELKRCAVLAMDAIGGAGMARVDFFYLEAERRLALNEINTLPGFTTISMYPRLWGLSGVPLPELCDRLVKLAVERAEGKRRLDAGLRSFVASQKG